MDNDPRIAIVARWFNIDNWSCERLLCELDAATPRLAGDGARPTQPSDPVDMVLWCPFCFTQHVDAPDGDWTNPPHRSHLCAKCGAIWRPADVATNGVAEIKTRGSRDTVDSRGIISTPTADPFAGGRETPPQTPEAVWVQRYADNSPRALDLGRRVAAIEDVLRTHGFVGEKTGDIS